MASKQMPRFWVALGTRKMHVFLCTCRGVCVHQASHAEPESTGKCDAGEATVTFMLLHDL
jgi:hypothetical protein